MAESQVPRRRERGAALLELAMVALPLMTIVLGIIEVGGAWKDKSSAVQASRQGARVVTSSSVANPDNGIYLADQQALLAVLAGLPNGVNSGGAIPVVRKVIIFDASITDAELDQCKDLGESGVEIHELPRDNNDGLGVGGHCNVYLAGNDPNKNSLDQTEIEDSSNFGGNGGDWDRKFDPDSDRSGTVGSATEIGVYVELFRPYITGLIPGEGMKVSGYTVMQVEPAGL
ncbi:MAG: pilus assembly protein [Acidimicrobiales bacterium]|nr:pilus assembly protein [Acidimicrobiales bacterium]